jgi:hypothetical protein
MSLKADDCSGYSGAALRYLVDAAREVTMPVGVLLWSQTSQQIWFRLPREGERVEGVDLATAQPFLVAAQEKIEGWHRLGRLPYAKGPLEPLSVAWWEQVRGLFQWSVRLGPVHSLVGNDPEAELEALYERTVEPQPAGRERLRRLEAAVERALGTPLSERFQRHPTVPGFGGRPVPVLRLAADDRRAVIVEAVNLAAATAEKEADALASRLASIRNGESEREIRFVLGYLAPAQERAGERGLRAWIEHVSGAALFDLEEEAAAFHAAAAASLAELKEPRERDGVARTTATRARPRRAVRSASQKTPLADAPASG